MATLLIPTSTHILMATINIYTLKIFIVLFATVSSLCLATINLGYLLAFSRRVGSLWHTSPALILFFAGSLGLAVLLQQLRLSLASQIDEKSLRRALIRSLLPNTRWGAHQPTVTHPTSPPLGTVRVDLDAFERLTQDRQRLHVKATQLEASAASLRNRIWFLENASATFRADITKHAEDYNELAKDHAELLEVKDALVRERDHVVAERDGMADKIVALHAENDTLRASKAGLTEDLEELQTETEELIDGKESIMVEKMVLEQKLALAEATAHKTTADLQKSQERRQMLEAQVAVKQEAVNDLMDELQGLKEDLRKAKRSWCDAQSEIDDLRSTNDAVVEESDALKIALETLRRTTVPRTELEGLQRSTVPKTELDALRRATAPLSDMHALTAELQATKDALDALRAAQDSLFRCPVACTALRTSADALGRTLAERDAEVAQLTAAFGACDARDAEMTASLAERDTYIAGLERVVEYLKLAPPSRSGATPSPPSSSALPFLSPATPLSSSSSSSPALGRRTSLASLSAFETPTKRPASVALLLRALETPASARPGQSLSQSFLKSSSAQRASTVAVAPMRKSPESPLMRPRWTLTLPARASARTDSSSSAASHLPPDLDSGSPWRGWWY
ncbi:hypothetical protein C8Q80DRAFT_1211992 [Daedaleopsis nitida]|nr:hypothetical protein C8Q80DRAFT_1211992 [Daedaleopsis nitida]